MLRKSGLEQQFRKSANPVKLKDWISMIWPVSSDPEMELMMRWAALREAWSIVHSKNFRCYDLETNRVYNLIDTEGGRGDIPLGEFVRAQILSQEECVKLFRTDDLHYTINRETFRSVVNPYLKANYVTNDTKNRMKQEEEAMMSSQYDAAFRNTMTAASSK